MFLFLALLLLAASREIQGGSLYPDTHIVGGDDVPEGGRPFQVSLDLKYDNKFYHFCGGSILNENYILTAAHCLKGFTSSDISILTGTTSLSKGGKRYNVKDFIVHEDFSKDYSFDYDIALLKLQDSIAFDDKTSAINLPTKDTGEESCVVSGWGYINNNKKTTDKMKMLTVKTLSQKVCRDEKLARYQKKVPLTERQICSFKQTGQGSCQGDSGGPLECSGEVVGITSYNVPCARGYPDVYTRVFKFKDWITSNMK